MKINRIDKLMMKKREAQINQTGYEDKNIKYFSKPRMEIRQFLPESAATVLEVGCGTGATLSWLKTSMGYEKTIGIELMEEMAYSEKNNIDKVLVGSIEEMDLSELFKYESIDLILCLDVLEHLNNPWKVIEELAAILKKGGTIIASIPNIRNIDITSDLIFKGDWAYKDEGILDRTHIRFFTKKTAIALMKSGGLKIQKVGGTMPQKYSKKWLLNKITFEIFSEFFLVQSIIKVTK
jgi:2-polyprenyl-3-methyl-5-hydroxy-6-metoxy-1,4-benzoquinol methylase